MLRFTTSILCSASAAPSAATSSISSLSKTARFLVSSANFVTEELKQFQRTARETNNQNNNGGAASQRQQQQHEQQQEKLTPRQERLRKRKEEVITMNPLHKWKQQRQQQHQQTQQQIQNIRDLSMIRAETRQLMTQEKMEKNKIEFQNKVEKELLGQLTADSTNSADNDNNIIRNQKYSISDLVVLLNALRFFDSERADLSSKLFELVLQKLKTSRKKYLLLVQQQKEGDGDTVLQNQEQQQNQQQKSKQQHGKLEYTKACRAASFALYACCKTGVVKASDMDEVLEIILSSTRSREIYLDAGALARCTFCLMMFEGLSSSSSSSSITTTKKYNGRNNNNNSPSKTKMVTEYLRILGKLPPTKFHDGSIRSSLATEFLQMMILYPHIKNVLRRTRSDHIVEHLCFVIAGRSNLRFFYDHHTGGAGGVGRRTPPPVVKSRVPFPEQLQRTQQICAKLGVFYTWLDSQLVHEASLCHGVLANHGEPQDELEQLHQRERAIFTSSNNTNGGGGGATVNLQNMSTSVEDQESIQESLKQLGEENNLRSAFPKDYPVMNYIDAFGDDHAPEPPVSGKFNLSRNRATNQNLDSSYRSVQDGFQLDSSSGEDGESETARRIKDEYGFNVKTDIDF